MKPINWSEGIEGRVAYKGSVADMVFQMIGGIRSGMGYVGAATIQDLIMHNLSKWAVPVERKPSSWYCKLQTNS